MLSKIDLLDFIDLDTGTVQVVHQATQLPAAEATHLARQLLATVKGLALLHHMFRDQIAGAAAEFDSSREKEMSQAYAYFSRKYPLPEMR